MLATDLARPKDHRGLAATAVAAVANKGESGYYSGSVGADKGRAMGTPMVADLSVDMQRSREVPSAVGR